MSVNDKQFEIDSDATPEDIIAAWREQQQAAGIDPNAAFQAQFGKGAQPGATTIRSVNEPTRDASGRFVPTTQPNQRQGRVSRYEVIGGKRLYFEAETSEDLNKQITDAYRVAAELQTAQEQDRQEQVTRQTNRTDAYTKAQLDLMLKCGQITTEQYLQESGVIADYLESHGAPVEQIVQTLQEGQSQRETQSWSDAVTEFLNSAPGAGWVGGEQNKDLIGLTIQQLGLVNAEDKVLALTQAWNVMKGKGMVFEGPRESEAKQVQAAMADASPAEILEAWKKGVAAQTNGSYASVEDAVNDTFMRTHSKTGSSSSLFGK
jgi:hypothetical protein